MTLLMPSPYKDVPQVPTQVLMPHRECFPIVLNELGLLNEGVEVGVKVGEYSQALLTGWKGRTLYSIDPWKEFPGGQYTDMANVQQKVQDAYYKKTCQTLAPFKERSVILRKTSAEAAATFSPGRFDFVYLDAQHHYEAVKEDIQTWWPLVKVGGILAGHDYVPDGLYLAGEFGVIRAVNEFAHDKGLGLCISDEKLTPPNLGYASWFLIKNAE